VGGKQGGKQWGKRWERCGHGPDPDGRAGQEAEGDLRGFCAGEGMWEMGVGKMCQMRHSHFAAYD